MIAQTSKKNEYNTPNLYAGIEVGSKGVKLSVIELKKNGQLGNSFFAVKDTSVNTDFISFTQQTFDATLNGLTGLFQTANTTFNIPSKRIFTVISSCLPAWRITIRCYVKKMAWCIGWRQRLSTNAAINTKISTFFSSACLAAGYTNTGSNSRRRALL